ncbi:MAG: hypothetical protein K0U08_01250 [Proteobacteria bacterium]|nr:hypothetical protein [Pseudomonadota bacterium]MCH9711308.1 hypothetical protein [Pseudomonadota bacterium]MCH9749813.1 hypothetical protein [Pseudomonadota bacterium]
MKTKFTILALTLLASLSVQAGLWEKMTTMGAPTIKPSSEYLVETAGWNIRVYEWIPADNPNTRCMFAAGSQKGGVACYSINN